VAYTPKVPAVTGNMKVYRLHWWLSSVAMRTVHPLMAMQMEKMANADRFCFRSALKHSVTTKMNANMYGREVKSNVLVLLLEPRSLINVGKRWE